MTSRIIRNSGWRHDKRTFLISCLCVFAIFMTTDNAFARTSSFDSESAQNEKDPNFKVDEAALLRDKMQFSATTLQAEAFDADRRLKLFDTVGFSDLNESHRMLVGKAAFRIPIAISKIEPKTFHNTRVLKKLLGLSSVENILDSSCSSMFRFTKTLGGAIGINLISQSKVEYFVSPETMNPHIAGAFAFSQERPDHVLVVSSSDFSKLFLKGLTVCGFEENSPVPTIVTCRFFTAVKQSSIEYIGSLFDKPLLRIYFKKYLRNKTGPKAQEQAVIAFMEDHVRNEAIVTANAMRMVITRENGENLK